MSDTKCTQIVLMALIASFAWAVSAHATTVDNVTAVRIVNQSPDGFYYVEEYTIPNAG